MVSYAIVMLGFHLQITKHGRPATPDPAPRNRKTLGHLGLKVEAGTRGPLLISGNTNLQRVQALGLILYKSVTKPKLFNRHKFLKTVHLDWLVVSTPLKNSQLG